MDFGYFPMDVQKCNWILYTVLPGNVLNLTWDQKAIRGEKLTGNEVEMSGFRVVYKTDCKMQSDDPNVLSLTFILYRDLTSYILMSYFPSGLMVGISWGSFLISPDVVPGRIVLIITSLLTLITLFNSLRQTIPRSVRVKPIEIWLIVCIAYLVSAMLEYLFVLLSIRRKTSWRKKNAKATPLQRRSDATRLFILRGHRPLAGRGVLDAKKKYGGYKASWKMVKTVFRALDVAAAEDLDFMSFILFPLSFLLFNIVYWIYFVRLRYNELKSTLRSKDDISL